MPASAGKASRLRPDSLLGPARRRSGTMGRMRSTLRAAVLFVTAAAVVVGAGDAPAAGDAAQQRWIDWHRARAARLLAEGRLPEAVEDLRVLTHLLPDDPDPPTQAAIAMVEQICEPPAEPTEDDPLVATVNSLIRTAVQRGAMHDPGIAYAIGRLRFALGDYKVAQRMLAIASRRGFDPIRARLWHYRAVVSDTQRLLSETVYDVAKSRLEDVMRESPEHPNRLAARLNLASVYRKRTDYVIAEDMLKKLVAEEPWMARAHLALGQCYVDLSRNDEAAECLRNAIERSQERDDGGLFSGRAVLLDALLWTTILETRRGDLDAATAALDRFAALRKDTPDEPFLRGTILLRRGGAENAQEAARLLRRCRRMDPARREFYPRLIEALNVIGEVAEAEEYQKELAKMDAARQARDAERRAGEATHSSPGSQAAPAPAPGPERAPEPPK